MRNHVFILLLCALAGSVLLPGCSKSRNASTSTGTGVNTNLASANADGPAEMRIKWTNGKKYSMRMEFKQNTQTPLPNQSEPLKGEVNLAQDFSISALKT